MKRKISVRIYQYILLLTMLLTIPMAYAQVSAAEITTAHSGVYPPGSWNSGNSQIKILVSSPSTLTAGYTDTEPSDPLAVAAYSYGIWSPSIDSVWTGSPSWYDANVDPFGSGARWISTQSRTEGGAGDQWRLFKTDFTIPDGSTVTSADLWYSADNAVAVYLNDELLNSTATVYGPSSDTTRVFLYSYHVSLIPKTRSNTLKFVVRNWKTTGYNPTGLLYKASIISKQSDAVLITKTIKPVSLKVDTDARISITVFNRGPTSVHDVEILDTTLPEFPVVNGITQYSVPLIEPNDTRILTYTVHAIKPGSFRLNKTAVMYADQDGNYHIIYSDYEVVEVLAPLIPQTSQIKSDDYLQNFFAWFNGFGRNVPSRSN